MPRFVFLARYRQELPFGGVLAGLSLSGGPLSLSSEEKYLGKPTLELRRWFWLRYCHSIVQCLMFDTVTLSFSVWCLCAVRADWSLFWPFRCCLLLFCLVLSVASVYIFFCPLYSHSVIFLRFIFVVGVGCCWSRLIWSIFSFIPLIYQATHF